MPLMIKVELTDSYVIKGKRLSVRVSHPKISEYRQVQVEVFDVGVANPSSKLGFGTTLHELGEHTAQVEVNSEYLPLGVYEIRLIRLHEPIEPNLNPQIDLIPGRDFTRNIFEVVVSIKLQRTADALLAEVQQREAELEEEFLVPVDIRTSKTSEASEYCVFVFARDVLIGTPMRFKHFELIPTQSGLDSKDELNFVNQFLREQTRTGAEFIYNEALETTARQSKPVCVIHFPMIISSSIEEARDHCIEQSTSLLLALSLSRDAGGTVFEAVVIDHHLGSAVKFSVTSPYIGNLLTGHLSGESAEGLEAYLEGLISDPMNSFLTSLYREARRDRSRDFQYVRFWQILETIAESNNYDPASPLLDYEGNVMMDGSQPRQTKGSVNIVFSLIRDSGVGSTTETWEKVNVWFAFRNAVAHHGSIGRFSELSREGVKAWARLGHEEISKSSGHDRYLWELKEDTKLLLMRKLVGAN